MQGSRAWLRLRRAWGVVSTGLCRRINQQLRRLRREENPDRGQRVRAEVLGQLGIALQPWEKLCPLGGVPRESSAGLAEVWERGGQSFAGLCHTSHKQDRAVLRWGCRAGLLLWPGPEHPCAPSKDLWGQWWPSPVPCQSLHPGVLGCSWAPPCPSLPARGSRGGAGELPAAL